MGKGPIGRRKNIEELTRREFDNAFILRRNPADADCCVVPPLLPEQKSLIGRIERRLPPTGIIEFGDPVQAFG